MKLLSNLLTVVASLILLFVVASTALAVQTEPSTLNYQGTLTDSGGQPLTGSKTITIRLYTVLSGGTAFWTDAYIVTLLNGQFSVILGSDANPLSPQLAQFNGVTYVGVQVGSDPEMTPRQKLTSVPYALVAGSVASTNSDSVIPAGTVVAFAGTNAPAGWLLCNGAEVSRTTYARLLSAIGTAHGIGNGSTTFNLPDYGGRFLRGVDNGQSLRDPDRASRSATNGGNTGNSVGSVQGHQFSAHNHTGSTTAINNETTGEDDFFDYNTYGGPYRGIARVDAQVNAANRYMLHTHGISYDGGNETRPVNAYVNWIIKY